MEQEPKFTELYETDVQKAHDRAAEASERPTTPRKRVRREAEPRSGEVNSFRIPRIALDHALGVVTDDEGNVDYSRLEFQADGSVVIRNPGQ